MIKLCIRFLIIFYLGIVNLYGQTDTIEQSLIIATNEFRNSILKNSPYHQDYEALKDRWMKIEEDKRIIDNLLFNIVYGIQVYDSEYKRIKKFALKQFPDSPLSEKITANDIEVIRNNLDLISFIQDEYLEDEYPYKLKMDTNKIHEIKFMNIQTNEYVADIGSGVGNQILLTSLIHKNHDFILSEKNFSLVEYLQGKVRRNRELLFQNQRSIDIAVGRNKTLNLGTRVDRIIVRNTFHHFKRKRKMLESMVEYLYPNGSVIFIEPLASNDTSIHPCKYKMEVDEIIKYIEESPLKIIEQEINNNILFISCKAKEERD